MKLLLTVITTLVSISAFSGTSYTPGSYQIDPMHSKVGFEVPHLVISSVEGRFNDYQGEIMLADKIEESKVEVTINANSIDTGIKKRDDHLRSADFFETSKYPKITFKSKRVAGAAENLKITGDLTIKGVTKEVMLDGKYLGLAKDGYGNLKAAFQAETEISRKDYGLTWNNAVEAGPVVGDEIKISLKVQGAKPEKKQAAR
ncbi:MAG: YceI family protein [Bdellovibrionota bacterium]